MPQARVAMAGAGRRTIGKGREGDAFVFALLTTTVRSGRHSSPTSALTGLEPIWDDEAHRPLRLNHNSDLPLVLVCVYM